MLGGNTGQKTQGATDQCPVAPAGGPPAAARLRTLALERVTPLTSPCQPIQAKKDASRFRVLVLIGVAAAFRTAFLPHMTKPSVASKLAQTNHPVAVPPPQWLPVVLATPSPTSHHRLSEAPPCADKSNKCKESKCKMSWFSSRSYDFNAPHRLKLGWMGPKSVVTYNATTGGVEDWAGASVPGMAYVSALNVGPATDRHLLLKIPCPTCTSAWDSRSHDNGNVYVSFRGDDAANSTYGVDNTIDWLNTFEGGACTNRTLRLMTNRVHVHYQRTSTIPSELWTTLGEGESYEIAGAAMAIHVCAISSELDAVVVVAVDSIAAKALCTTPSPPPPTPSPPPPTPSPLPPPMPPPHTAHDGPLQVFIMAGQPACLRGLSCVSHHTLAVGHRLSTPLAAPSCSRCAALQPSRPARAHALGGCGATLEPGRSRRCRLLTSQASPTWRGLVPQHGTKVTPW